MSLRLSLVPLVVNLCCVLSLPNPYPDINLHPLEEIEDVGEPLILTPYLESGDLQKARDLASVSLQTETELISYSGFLTVNQSANSNMFFWYFQARENPDTAPTLIWLQGGPGVSSLYGLFMENGPFYLDEDLNLIDREYSWHINHNLIYFDNPVGTGFSWSDDDGYARNEAQVGDNLYEAMSQFYVMFPELRLNPLYISGESYAGKYVPALGYKIHQMNAIVPEAHKMNMAGLLIGNGWSDPIHQLDYGDFLYQLGLIDANSRNISYTYRDKVVQALKNKDFDAASNYSVNYLFWIQDLIALPSIYNYVYVVDPDTPNMTEFLSKPEITMAIHVGNATFNTPDRVYGYLHSDNCKTVVPLISKLLDHYKVCVYSGQLDIIIGYPLTANYLSHLEFKDRDEYLKKNRTIWRVDDQVAGYVKEAGNLVEVLVRNAGHMVPMDQPKWALDMLLHITNSTKF